MSEHVWHVTSKEINEYVRAPDQFEAWNTLRGRPVEDFGLIVTAEPDENEDESICVHTAALMLWWDRPADAELAFAAAERAGLPDTREANLAFAAARRSATRSTDAEVAE